MKKAIIILSFALISFKTKAQQKEPIKDTAIIEYVVYKKADMIQFKEFLSNTFIHSQINNGINFLLHPVRVYNDTLVKSCVVDLIDNKKEKK